MNRTLLVSVTLCLLGPAAQAASGTQETSTPPTHPVTHHHPHKAATQTSTVVTHTRTVTTHATHGGTTTVRTVQRKVTKTEASRPTRPVTVADHEPHHHPARPHPTHVAVAPPPTPPVPPPPKTAAVVAPVPLDKGSATGLPLPRYAALRSDQVNWRAGPGTRYPIDWIYQRRDLPVRIEREFEVWRLVSDADGTKGWVNQATLTGRRSFVVNGDQPQALRAAATSSAAAVAMLKPGVVGQLQACPAGSDWCSVSVKAYHGYLNRSAFWGSLPNEIVGP